MSSQSQVATAPTSWEFTFTREPVSPDEQAYFADDLGRLGLDEIAWLILNGTAATGTRYSIPKVLRGYRDGRLAGVAYLVECRRYGQSLFGQTRMATLIDAAPMPICIWMRHGALTDAISNPGFVADGVARDEFVAQAALYLKRSYLMGGILEGSDNPAAGNYATFPFCDYGILDLHNKHSVDDLYPNSKNLKRKMHKFRNKGGEIELICGALSPELCDDAIRCISTLRAGLITPFQDNYNNMVLRASTQVDERILHFIARIKGECVGYHSFAWSGHSLYCLSGAFDRTRHSTYHAYENLILASANFCMEQGLRTIYYGPIVNETKAKMMSRFIPAEQRFFARFDLLNVFVRKLMTMTRLTSPELASYINIAATMPAKMPAKS